MILTFLLATPVGRAVSGVVVAGALLGGAYVYGYTKGSADADNAAEVAAVQSALKAAYADLNAQREAAETQRKFAEENKATADELEKQVADYAAELQKRPDDRCLAGADDVGRLRAQPVPGPAGKKPAARGTRHS